MNNISRALLNVIKKEGIEKIWEVKKEKFLSCNNHDSRSKKVYEVKKGKTLARIILEKAGYKKSDFT